MIKRIIQVSVLSIFSTVCEAQKPTIQAAFIFNFTKYIEWPETLQKDFKIAVWKDRAMVEALEVIAVSKKIKNKRVVVNSLSDVSSLGSYQILYVGEVSAVELKEIRVLAEKYSVLVISNQVEEPGIAGINFKLVNDRPAFEVNKDQLTASKLKVSSSLLGMAVNVK